MLLEEDEAESLLRFHVRHRGLEFLPQGLIRHLSNQVIDSSHFCSSVVEIGGRVTTKVPQLQHSGKEIPTYSINWAPHFSRLHASNSQVLEPPDFTVPAIRRNRLPIDMAALSCATGVSVGPVGQGLRGKFSSGRAAAIMGFVGRFGLLTSPAVPMPRPAIFSSEQRNREEGKGVGVWGRELGVLLVPPPNKRICAEGDLFRPYPAVRQGVGRGPWLVATATAAIAEPGNTRSPQARRPNVLHRMC